MIHDKSSRKTRKMASGHQVYSIEPSFVPIRVSSSQDSSGGSISSRQQGHQHERQERISLGIQTSSSLPPTCLLPSLYHHRQYHTEKTSDLEELHPQRLRHLLISSTTSSSHVVQEEGEEERVRRRHTSSPSLRPPSLPQEPPPLLAEEDHSTEIPDKSHHPSRQDKQETTGYLSDETSRKDISVPFCSCNVFFISFPITSLFSLIDSTEYLSLSLSSSDTLLTSMVNFDFPAAPWPKRDCGSNLVTDFMQWNYSLAIDLPSRDSWSLVRAFHVSCSKNHEGKPIEGRVLTFMTWSNFFPRVLNSLLKFPCKDSSHLTLFVIMIPLLWDETQKTNVQLKVPVSFGRVMWRLQCITLSKETETRLNCCCKRGLEQGIEDVLWKKRVLCMCACKCVCIYSPTTKRILTLKRINKKVFRS